jgi:hypothetical protein
MRLKKALDEMRVMALRMCVLLFGVGTDPLNKLL